MIEIRPTALGPQPFLSGTGLTVWELRHMLADHGGSVAALRRNHPHLGAAGIREACTYAEAHAAEEPVGLWGVKPDFFREVRI